MLNRFFQTKAKNGLGMVEAVIGLGIIVFVSFSFIQAYNYFLKIALARSYETRAILLAEEGIEAVKFLRDSGWTANILPLSVSFPYSVNFDGLNWTLGADESLIDNIFFRTVAIEDVYRDASDDIADAGTLDAGTKKVTVSVSFRTAVGTSTRSVFTYLTNLFND